MCADTHLYVSFRVKKNIFWFNITMDHILSMTVAQGIC